MRRGEEAGVKRCRSGELRLCVLRSPLFYVDGILSIMEGKGMWRHEAGGFESRLRQRLGVG